MWRWHLHILASELVRDDNLAQTWQPQRAQVLSGATVFLSSLELLDFNQNYLVIGVFD